MKTWMVLAGLLLTGAARAGSPDGADSALERSADALLVGIPVLALGLTFILPDDTAAGATPASGLAGFDFVHLTGAPRHDLTLAILRTEAIAFGLKSAVDSERPNGEDGSFPSGHTATTFAGAEFIRKEYGWRWGAPAYLAASYVGWSRVETRDHWWRDVIAGAAIGVLSNHDLRNFDTAWGRLSLQPSLIKARAWEPEGYGDAADVSRGAPGVNLELRF